MNPQDFAPNYQIPLTIHDFQSDHVLCCFWCQLSSFGLSHPLPSPPCFLPWKTHLWKPQALDPLFSASCWRPPMGGLAGEEEPGGGGGWSTSSSGSLSETLP